jgi:hypothetical protein
MSTMGIADWLPGAVRDALPDVVGAPRLLDALLEAVERQRSLLEDDIDSVWDDFFIESCSDWAVPYIASLLGLPADTERLEVAYAVALRRRKGTPAALEDFAEVVTGLTARVIEGWQVTLWAQRPLQPPLRMAAVDLRDGSRHRIGTPFERTRRSFTPSQRWSPRAATAIVWPWRVLTYSDLGAAPLAEENRFSLHPLGAEAPLYLRPRQLRLQSAFDPEAAQTRTQDELDAPVRATYRVLESLAQPEQITYGTNWVVDPAHPLADQSQPALVSLSAGGTAIPWTKLRFGALPPGAAAPAGPGAEEAVVDLLRGFVELGSDLDGPLRATWHRPVPGRLGALASTADVDPAARVVVTLNPTLPAVGLNVHTLADAFDAAETASAGLSPDESISGSPDVEVRLETSDRLAAPSPQDFTPTLRRWRIVAPRFATPTMVGDLALDLEGACMSLEGFQLTGDLVLGATLDTVSLRNVTMDPASGKTVLVDSEAWGLTLKAERCLLGAVRADLGAVPITLTDCVVDGLGAHLRVCDGSEGGTLRDAVACAATFDPALRADGVTFVGAVRLEAADAVDCVFTDGIEVVQQQEGCLRHCFLGPDLTTPPSHPTTYRCGPFPAPSFASIDFEAAGYYTLALEPDHPLLAAASDGGEVGAYHHARRAFRIARLRRRIHEFVPLGLRPGLSLATWEE